MANFTKKAIKESFLKLLNERPLSKITVKDIVEDCEINRNSFYYHFQDIPCLIVDIVTEETDKLIAEYPDIDSLEVALDAAINFALQHRKAILHIFNSVSRDILESELLKICDHAIRSYIAKHTEELNVIDGKLTDSDRELTIKILVNFSFGLTIHWMIDNMNSDILDDFHRLLALRSLVDSDTIEFLLRR